MTAGSGQAALANGRAVDRYEQGYCLQFVRGQCWAIGSLYGSAIDAWYGAVHKHPGDRTPPVGAPCFYSGGQYGHVVVYADDDPDMRSTDCPEAGRVSDADLGWPERTWGSTYLGWAEDLNGVDLPLTKHGEEDEMNTDDEITEWSPDEGATGKITVGKTLNQARGYSEDTYQRVNKLQDDVADLKKTVGKIAKALGV